MARTAHRTERARQPLARACAAAFIAALSATALAAPPGIAPTEDAAIQIARATFDGRYDAVVARFDESLRARVGRQDLERWLDDKRRERAPAKLVRVRERRSDRDGATYTVQCRWTRGASSELLLSMRPNGTVAQMQIWDDDDPQYQYQTKTKLRPPFKGTWTSGNATADIGRQNYDNPNLRFSIEWVIRDATGKTYRTDGKRNSDYYAYGQPALAPAAGTVVVAVDGVPENPTPGQIDRYNAPGNYLVIDLGNGEYAMLMHLISGSLRVRRGQRVVAGQILGRVGSSGHCTEPNLQFQIADKPRLSDARSLPVTFTRVLFDDEQAEQARPVYGSRLSPADHWNPNGPMREPDED